MTQIKSYLIKTKGNMSLNQFNQFCSSQHFSGHWLRDVLLRKNSCSFGFCPNYFPPLILPPIWTTCTAFSSVEIQNFKVSLGLKRLYILHITLCIYIYNLKKQFKVKIIGILEEIDSSSQKCTSWICAEKFGQGPPPLIWTTPKRTIQSERSTVVR